MRDQMGVENKRRKMSHRLNNIDADQQASEIGLISSFDARG